jgi:uncharacterized membrane protein
MTRNATATSTSPWRRLALGFVFAWFFIGGVFHFTATPAFVSIMPPYAPWPVFWVLFTGGCEIAGAIGIWIPKLRRIAGWALIALTVCVTPANLEMALHAERYPAIGAGVLWLRMAFQPVLIWIIWWATRR